MSITAKEARKNAENVSRKNEVLDIINHLIESRSKEGLTEYRYAFSGGIDDWKIRKAIVDDLEERGFYVKYSKFEKFVGINEIMIRW